MTKIREKKRKDIKINLFGMDYSIEFKDQVFSTKDSEKSYWVFGESDLGDCNIKISTKSKNNLNLTPRVVNITLLHELVHAILASGMYQETQDEPLVEWIAKCVYSLYEQGLFKVFEDYEKNNSIIKSSKDKGLPVGGKEEGEKGRT